MQAFSCRWLRHRHGGRVHVDDDARVQQRAGIPDPPGQAPHQLPLAALVLPLHRRDDERHVERRGAAPHVPGEGVQRANPGTRTAAPHATTGAAVSAAPMRPAQRRGAGAPASGTPR